MARLFVKMMLGLLTTLAVVLPFVLNKRNYDPALQRARDVVRQTEDRAKSMDDVAAGVDPATDGQVPSEAAQDVQQISRGATSKGRMSLDEAHRLRDAMDKLNKERRELADQ